MDLEPAHLGPTRIIVGAQYLGQKTLVKRQAGQPRLRPREHTLSPGARVGTSEHLKG